VFLGSQMCQSCTDLQEAGRQRQHPEGHSAQGMEHHEGIGFLVSAHGRTAWHLSVHINCSSESGVRGVSKSKSRRSTVAFARWMGPVFIRCQRCGEAWNQLRHMFMPISTYLCTAPQQQGAERATPHWRDSSRQQDGCWRQSPYVMSMVIAVFCMCGVGGAYSHCPHPGHAK
jgi:hypothetical protein